MLGCEWRDTLPPVEERYPPILRRLTEVVKGVPFAWFASISRLGREIRRLAERFTALVPGMASLPPLGMEGAMRSWEEAAESVRLTFAGHVGVDLTRGRLAMPVDHALFCVMIPAGLHCPDELGMSYFDSLRRPEAMARETASNCRMYAEKHPDPAALARCGLWLFVGYLDKHDFHLCCDTASPLFGTLVDQHDSHPWIGPPDGPSTWDVENRCFIDFLRLQVGESEENQSMTD